MKRIYKNEIGDFMIESELEIENQIEWDNRNLYSYVKEILTYPAPKRIELTQKGLFVRYPIGDNYMKFLKDLDTQPRRPRMMGRALIGPSGIGKTTLNEQYINLQIKEQQLDLPQYKYLRIETPPTPSPKSLYLRILNKCNFDITRGTTEELFQKVLSGLEKLQTRMLFIDDIDHLLNSQNERIKGQCRDTLKDISNCLMIPIILIGTDRAASVIKEDKQISSRYPIIHLNKWKYDPQFCKLLISFESGLPLRKASHLEGKEISQLIYDYSGGILGSVSEILIECTKEAILNGSEKITPALIKARHDAPFSRY